MIYNEKKCVSIDSKLVEDYLVASASRKSECRLSFVYGIGKSINGIYNMDQLLYDWDINGDQQEMQYNCVVWLVKVSQLVVLGQLKIFLWTSPMLCLC